MLGKAYGKNETDGFGEKFTYDDGSIRLISKLQASIQEPRNTDEKCQGWLSPCTFAVLGEC